MAHYQVVIETSEGSDGFRADVAEGPAWAKEEGCTSGYQRALAAYNASKRFILDSRRCGPLDTFDFLHIGHGEERGQRPHKARPQ